VVLPFGAGDADHFPVGGGVAGEFVGEDAAARLGFRRRAKAMESVSPGNVIPGLEFSKIDGDMRLWAMASEMNFAPSFLVPVRAMEKGRRV